ncbi:MAG TPA: BON domain-containing protein [Thermoanaerobaculia bacterium]|nr:BON domain-containing protein [Thermoanaerobaculia bacterium]
MKKRDQLTLLGGVSLGAGLMYLLDPDGGGRRRALARDKAVHGLTVSGKALRKTSADLGNRTRGLVAQAGSRLHKDGAEVQVLEARVRSKLGRHVSHPSAIQVQCEEDRVILSGPVLASEVDKLLHKVKKVKGVHKVENRLEVQDTSEGMPAEGSNGRFSLPAVNKRNAALGLGALAGTVGLGLLARTARSGNLKDLARPLSEQPHGAKDRKSAQLEW